MTMTKQDFELVEAAVKEVVTARPSPEVRAAFEAVALILCRRFLKINPRFDPKRFMEGCGLSSTIT